MLLVANTFRTAERSQWEAACRAWLQLLSNCLPRGPQTTGQHGLGQAGCGPCPLLALDHLQSAERLFRSRGRDPTLSRPLWLFLGHVRESGAPDQVLEC